MAEQTKRRPAPPQKPGEGFVGQAQMAEGGPRFDPNKPATTPTYHRRPEQGG